MEEILGVRRFNLELETSECCRFRRVHVLISRGGRHYGRAVVYTHLELTIKSISNDSEAMLLLASVDLA